MNDILDKLLIRFLFAVVLSLLLIIYKYAHAVLYPSGKKQVFKNFNPSENSADTLHMFARLIGIGLIFSNLEYSETNGLILSLFHFIIWGVVSVCIYLFSIYIIESIALSDFIYVDEILKRKNMTYSIVSFTNSIAIAFIIKKVVAESEYSFILLIMFWLFALVLFGFAIKAYSFFTKLNFKRLVMQMNSSVGYSYMGFILGCTYLITMAFSHTHYEVKTYGIQVILSIILSILIFPWFILGIHKIFKITNQYFNENIQENPTIGYGIYEGATYFTSALLTSVIIGHIQFGIIYPAF
jgi:uncharacterized membrane protein YjfL (UPF0719 family)